LWEGGVRILVGTDSGTPMNFHYESTWQEMDLLVRYGMPPMKVISAATRLPAQLYGLGNELGTIEPGRLADIIVVAGNPLRDMSALSNVIHVIKGGVQYR
jgi:imidazolonepropionase-like amidohydrolase